MKLHDDYAAADVYAFVYGADHTYTGISNVLSHSRYALVTIRLDEFEKQFRACFDLEIFTQQQQDKPVTFTGKNGSTHTIFITEELYNKWALTFNTALLNNGYVTLLKKTFIQYASIDKQVLPEENINNYITTVNAFAERLQRSVRIAAYSSFTIKNTFVHLPNSNKIILQQPFEQPPSTNNATLPFNTKDNYFINLYLNAEHKLQPVLQQATKLFAFALETQDFTIQLMQFVHLIELCFGTLETGEDALTLSKYVYVLLYNTEVDFNNFNKEVQDVFELKQLPGKNTDHELLQPSTLTKKTKWLEQVIRNTLKKLIRVNHIKKEMLLVLLEKKFRQL